MLALEGNKTASLDAALFGFHGSGGTQGVKMLTCHRWLMEIRCLP